MGRNATNNYEARIAELQQIDAQLKSADATENATRVALEIHLKQLIQQRTAEFNSAVEQLEEEQERLKDADSNSTGDWNLRAQEIEAEIANRTKVFTDAVEQLEGEVTALHSADAAASAVSVKLNATLRNAIDAAIESIQTLMNSELSSIQGNVGTNAERITEVASNV